MSIRVVCRGCGKGVKAPEKYAGKVVKCPGCKSPLQLPKVTEASSAPSAPSNPQAKNLKPEPASLPPPPPPQPVSSELVVSESIDCPYCSEPIKRTAKKCKHCGEFLDAALRDSASFDSAIRDSYAATPVAAPAAAPVAVQVNIPMPQQRYWNKGIAALLSFLIPGAGQLYKGQVLNGLVWFLLTVVGYFFLIIPGLIIHVCSIVGATMGDEMKPAR